MIAPCSLGVGSMVSAAAACAGFVTKTPLVGLQEHVTYVSTTALQMEAYRMSKRRDDDPLADIEAAKAAKASGYNLV